MQRMCRLTQWLRDYKRVKKRIKSFLRWCEKHSPELLVQTKKRFKKTIKPLRKVKRQYAAKLQQLQERQDAQRCTSPPETFHTPVTTLKQELTGQHRDRLSSAVTRLTLFDADTSESLPVVRTRTKYDASGNVSTVTKMEIVSRESAQEVMKADLERASLGARCAVFWALKIVPEDLWARGVVCPAERAVMLGATSKRVRALLAQMQRRVPAAVHVVGGASMDAVAGGLGGLQGWCRVVRLDLKRGVWAGRGAPFGDEGAGRLAGVLGQCSSLAVLNLYGNGIGADGAGRLAGVLGQCSLLAELNLAGNGIGADGIRLLRTSIRDATQLSV